MIKPSDKFELLRVGLRHLEMNDQFTNFFTDASGWEALDYWISHKIRGTNYEINLSGYAFHSEPGKLKIAVYKVNKTTNLVIPDSHETLHVFQKQNWDIDWRDRMKKPYGRPIV
jgi:hypothetical protein